ncbi:hypothetical protein PFISCL1PPCAC_14568, partial [Pristionchus fissidentatus]
IPMSPSSILITGANRGIGLGFVHHYLSLPSVKHVFATAREPEKATELNSIYDNRLHVVRMDVRCDQSIIDAEKQISSIVGSDGLTLLINNAGILDRYDIDATPSRSRILTTMDINVAGPIVVSQVFLPLLRKAASTNSSLPVGVNRAAIVNISSGVASMQDNTSGGNLIYRTSKTALNSLTKTFGHHTIKDDILTVAILPGYVITALVENRGELTVEQSVAMMVKVFDTWTKESNGLYYAKEGHLYPL